MTKRGYNATALTKKNTNKHKKKPKTRTHTRTRSLHENDDHGDGKAGLGGEELQQRREKELVRHVDDFEPPRVPSVARIQEAVASFEVREVRERLG